MPSHPRAHRAVRAALVILQLFVALGAFYGGGALIAEPSGALLGMDVALLARSPFSTFLIPGLVLFSVNGMGMACGAATNLFGWKHAPLVSMLNGIALAGWMTGQIAMIGLIDPQQPVFFALGGVLFLLAFALRRLASR